MRRRIADVFMAKVLVKGGFNHPPNDKMHAIFSKI
jgi:hypothetical protein